VATDKKQRGKSTSFTEREIKAFLQVCRGLDKGEINEATRSKLFVSVRAKFVGMHDRLEKEKHFDL
jgi:hypothetical protein